MATLTGQTISSTYDGLLKTTDNDVLTSGGKVITDGLGNSTGVTLDTNGNIIATGTIKATGGIKDTSDDLGTSGQVLSSTGTGTNWIDSTAPVDSVNGATGVVVLDSDDIAEGATNKYLLADSVTNAKMAANSVDSDQYVDGSIDTVHLANDVVTYDKLGVEFTSTEPLGSVSGSATLNFATDQVFTATMTANTTFSFSNANIGMTKDLILTGSFDPTFPAGTKQIAGTYDGSVSNFIQIVAVANGDYWLSVSQEQV